MDVLADLARTLVKMFAADLWLTCGAIAVVVIVRLGLAQGLLPAAAAPWLLAAGVLGALVLGVVHGAGSPPRKG